MKSRVIYITKKDKERLEELILVAKGFSCDRLSELTELSKDLSRARVVPVEELPAKVVTLNSKVELGIAILEEKSVCTLVFPGDVTDKNTISVLSPVGMAILGYAEGDTVTWDVPSGRCSIKIQKVLYQPKASGNRDFRKR